MSWNRLKFEHSFEFVWEIPRFGNRGTLSAITDSIISGFTFPGVDFYSVLSCIYIVRTFFYVERPRIYFDNMISIYSNESNFWHFF